MPIISQFYGISIKIYFEEGKRHHKEHIHIFYNEYIATYDLKGNMLNGKLPKRQRKMVEGWIAIHELELNNLWKEIQNNGKYFKIEPLK